MKVRLEPQSWSHQKHHPLKVGIVHRKYRVTKHDNGYLAQCKFFLPSIKLQHREKNAFWRKTSPLEFSLSELLSMNIGQGRRRRTFRTFASNYRSKGSDWSHDLGDGLNPHEAPPWGVPSPVAWCPSTGSHANPRWWGSPSGTVWHPTLWDCCDLSRWLSRWVHRKDPEAVRPTCSGSNSATASGANSSGLTMALDIRL